MASTSFIATQGHWTLRFKSGKGTMFLHTDPDEKFSEIKKDLLNSIKSLPESSELRKSLGTLPTDPNAIVFGFAIDKNDLEQGWVPQGIRAKSEVKSESEMDEVDEPDDDDSDVLNRSPRDAGLKDGAAVAFRFKDGQPILKGNWGVEIPKVYDDDDEMMEDEPGTSASADPRLADRTKIET